MPLRRRSVVLTVVLASCVLAATASGQAQAPTVRVEGSVLVFDATGESVAEVAPGERPRPEAGFEFRADHASGPGFRTARGIPADRRGPGCFEDADGSEGDPAAFCPSGGLSAVVVRGPLTGPQDRLSPTPLVLRDPTGGTGPQPPISMRVEAGSGHDDIFVGDDARQDVSCGPGLDRVAADARDVVEADCETVEGDPQRLPGHPGVFGKRAIVRVGTYNVSPAALYIPISCPSSAPDDSCTGRIDVVYEGPPKLGWGSVPYALRRGRRTTVLVPVGHDRGRVTRLARGGNPSSVTPPALKRRVRRRGRATMRLHITSGSATSTRRVTVTKVKRQRRDERWRLGAQAP